MENPLYCAVADAQADLPLDLPATLSETKIEKAIAKWSRYVDDYLAGQYQIPFPGYPNTPGSVSMATAMLTTWWLYVNAGMSSEKDDSRQGLWNRAHEMLDKIKAREIILGSGEDLNGAVRESPPLITGGGKSRASWAVQERELGPVHHTTTGGFSWPRPEDEQP